MSKTTGFTVLELLTVIAMIGLLIAVAQPILTTSASRTYEYDCESHLRQVAVSMHAYSQDYGVFPNRLANLDNLLQDKTLLRCPKTSVEYYYQQPLPSVDPDTIVASCVKPTTQPGRLPHREGRAYLGLTAGGSVKRIMR